MSKCIDKHGLFALMEQNNLGRNQVDAPLINLDDIQEVSWVYDLPTLFGKERCKCIESTERCFKALCEIIGRNFIASSRIEESFMTDPFIELITGGNFILAGGSVCDLLNIRSCEHSRYNHYTGVRSDFDLFAIGISPEEAEARIEKFIVSISEKSSNISVSLFRTPNCITALTNHFEFQFITRIYESVSQVLYGFDIAASAVALTVDRYGKPSIMMTPLAAFTHKTGVFPLDLERRRASFERRIYKYHESKGFGVIFPNLNPNALNYETTIELKEMKLYCRDVKSLVFNGYIDCDHGYNTNNPDHPEDSDHAVYGTLPYHSWSDIVMFNVSKLLWNNNYLVTTQRTKYHGYVPEADIANFTLQNWRVIIGDVPFENDLPAQHAINIPVPDALPIVQIIYRKLYDLSIRRNIKGIINTFNYREDFSDLIIAATKYIVANKCNIDEESQITEFVDVLTRMSHKFADAVIERAKHIAPHLEWKAFHQGTTLASCDAMPFALKYIEPAEYYGESYVSY